MYAVIKTGGKQHKVKSGDVISVELIEGEAGDKVTFEPILVVDDAGGTHVGKEVAGATVTGTLAGEKKGKKVKVFKYKPKTGYKKTIGHRQQYTVIEIEGIEFKAKKAAPKKAKEDAPAKASAAAGDEAAEGAG